MTRRRAPKYDYICRRCLCACRADGSRHLGGGSANFTACGQNPIPVLRSDWEASIKADVASLRDRHAPGKKEMEVNDVRRDANDAHRGTS